MRFDIHLAARASIAALSTLALAACVETGSSDAARVQETTVRVSYADLDIARPEDAAELRRRVERAARAACDHQSQTSVPERTAYRECYRDAVSIALTGIDHPAVEEAFADAAP